MQVGTVLRKVAALEVVGVPVEPVEQVEQVERLAGQEEQQGQQGQTWQQRPAWLSPDAPSPAVPASVAPVFSAVPAPGQRVHSEPGLCLLVH